MLVHDKPFQPFADGVVVVYTVVNLADEGDRPREGLHKIYKLPYDRKTVGLTRYVEGLQANVKIEEVISVPYRADISTQNIVAIEGTQYRIWQTQTAVDTRPKTLRLTLEKVVEDYEVENPGF